MRKRDYQIRAHEAIHDEWTRHTATLLVMPTGTGKTVTFAHAIDECPGRAMVIAHREELIHQAARTIERVTGFPCDIEMADRRADGSMFRRAKVVIASKDSLHEKRLARFDPFDFERLIIDEAHHAIAPTYRRIIDHFKQNPKLRVLGVTATPDRLDEKALGQVFESCAMCYEVLDAIEDGYLVPIQQRTVAVASLNYKDIGTIAGDFNQKQLAQLMEFEQNLHAIADPVLKLARWNRTLIFAAGVKHADRLCEILNRHRADCARFVHGGTPKDERAIVLRDYAAGKFQFMVNVGVFTEGFDDPGIGMVAIARPTKSRALYAQMIGRGTRPLPGIIDGLETPDERRDAIRRSRKSRLEVLDFEGQAGTHKLITTADVLGGDYDQDVIDMAAGIVARAGGEVVDTVEALKEAARARHEEKQREAEVEAKRRHKLLAQVDFTTRGVDPFAVFDIEPRRVREWERQAEPPSDKQVSALKRWGVPTEGLSKQRATQLIGECIHRKEKGLCSYKMAAQLRKRGMDPHMRFEDAKKVLDDIAARDGWGSKQEVTS